MSYQQKCLYCDDLASLACDFRLGLLSLDKPTARCDAPLCKKHAMNRGRIFWQGEIDTVDWCHTHQEKDEGQAGDISLEEADRIRYRHRCKASGGLRLVDSAKRPLQLS